MNYPTIIKWAGYGVFFVVVVFLLYWFSVLLMASVTLKKPIARLEEKVTRLNSLQVESSSLRSKIFERRKEEEAQKKYIISQAYLAKDLKDFPIQTGNHFVVQGLGSWERRGIRLYVPAGIHKLNIDLGRSLVAKNDKRSNDGEHFVKTFELPPNSVCEFLLRLKATENQYIATLSLMDADLNRLFDKELEFPRHAGEGSTNGGGTGVLTQENVFLPNRFIPKGPFDFEHWANYKSTSELSLRWADEGRYVFSFHCNIQSPERPQFVHASDADMIPVVLWEKGKSFDDVFEPLTENKYLFKPTAAGIFQR